MRPVDVVLADDHGLLRVGIKAFIEDTIAPKMRVVGEAESGEEALALVAQHDPDLLLLDLSMGGMGGLETILELRRRNAKTRILVLTQYDDPALLQRVMQAGANGYLLKSARGEELVVAVRAVLEGGTYLAPSLAASLLAPLRTPAASDIEASYASLTPRERQILALVAQGFSNKEIAQSLELAVKTVMSHRFNLTEKLGIHNRSKLIQFAIKAGLLPME